MKSRFLGLFAAACIPLGLFVFAGQAGASPVRGTGEWVNVTGARIAGPVVNVDFAINCTTTQDEATEPTEDADTTPDTYILVINFNLVLGSVSNSGGNNGTYPQITCNGEAQHFTFSVPNTGYVQGDAMATAVNVAALDSDNSCGTVQFMGQTFPRPCDGNFPGFNTSVQIH